MELSREEKIQLITVELQEADRDLTAIETALEEAEAVIDENAMIYDALLTTMDQIIEKRFALRRELRDVIES